MISFLIANLFKKADCEAGYELSLECAVFMSVLECVMFLLYIYFGIIILGYEQVFCVFMGLVFAVYTCLTSVIDWLTGYVYDIVNLIVLISLIVFLVLFSDVSSIFDFNYFLYAFILIFCERMNAFCKGDTEFLFVMYGFFVNKNGVDFAIQIMLLILLDAAVLFGFFRTITGRREGMIPYTPFVVLAEIINIIFFSVINH